MPKETINIKTFNGMIGSVDAHDAPAGSAVFAENIDNIQQQGLFTPLPKDQALSGVSQDATCDLVTPFSDGSVGVIYDQDDTTVKVISLDTGSVADADSVTRARTGGFDTAISDGEAAHVGLGGGQSTPPVWVGEIFHGQFGGSAPSGVRFEGAEIEWAECVGVYTTNSSANTAFMLPTETVTNSISQWDVSQVSFNNGSSYYYYASLVYDGFQEGPLFLIATLNLSDRFILFNGTGSDFDVDSTSLEGGTVYNLVQYNSDQSVTPTASTTSWQTATKSSDINEQPATGLARVDFEVRVRTATSTSRKTLSPRVTRINLYRAEDVTGSFKAPYQWYKNQFGVADPVLFQSIDINDTDWGTATIDQNLSDFDFSADTYKKINIKDTGVGYETFTGRTALPLGLSNMQLHYGVSCVAESYHVVAQCWHPELKQIESWLFKSKPYRYDTFDWSADYLVLPTPPNALAYWMGKIYAFCDGRTYVINPATFDIEDTIEGIGAAHRKAIRITDRGMFWGDENNIYWHNGNTIVPIGNAVLRNQYNPDAAWLERGGNTIVTVYAPRYDAIIFAYETNSNEFGALMFNIGGQRWSYITTDLLTEGGSPIETNQNLSCGYQKSNGEPVLGFDGDSGGVDVYYHIFGSTSANRSWKFVSQQIKDGGSKTRYYHVRISHYGNPPSVSFYKDDPDYTTANSVTLASEISGSVSKGQLTTTADDWQYLRDFAIEFSGTGTQSASEAAIIYRPISSR
jgi:hypothetical protein